MTINFDELINDFSDDGFVLSKKYLSEYISRFYVRYEDMNRLMFVEKLCDYIMSFEYRNNKKDSSIPELYSSELLSIINKIVKAPKKDEVPTQAFRYALRAQQITERVKKGDCQSVVEDLEDISKIFLCIYDHYLKNNHVKVEKIDFKIPGIGFDYIRTDLIKENKFNLLKPKEKDEEEMIYNTLKLNERNNIYNTRNFVIMVLSLFYIRLIDLEGKD